MVELESQGIEMSLDIQVPKQLKEEVKRVFPQLKLIIPAAAAVAWFVGRVFFHGNDTLKVEEADREEEDEGEVIDVELPALAGRGPTLPFTPPRPLHNVLLDATFPISINSLWTFLLSGNSTELVEFHRSIGDIELSLSPWRKRANGSRVRILNFTTPLKNPLGPKRAFNREELTVTFISPRAFVLTAVANSKGVPFASNFQNHVQWVAYEEGAAITRVCITGECRFLTPIWGPLKGTINRESIKGMERAYRILETTLADNFGILRSETPGSTAVVVEPTAAVISKPRDTGLAGLFQTSQSNPAVLIVLVAMFVIMWRMALLNTLTMQVFQRLAAAKA